MVAKVLSSVSYLEKNSLCWSKVLLLYVLDFQACIQFFLPGDQFNALGGSRPLCALGGPRHWGT